MIYFVDPGVEKVRFVKDLSAWWYKPHATRDEGKIIKRFINSIYKSNLYRI